MQTALVSTRGDDNAGVAVRGCALVWHVCVYVTDRESCQDLATLTVTQNGCGWRYRHSTIV